MSISFATHRKEMVDAYKAILDDNNETDWALFSYKANNELYLESTGDEGLEELESEFNSGKMQYAFVRILDPNTKMKKFLLIIWQGEGVPATRKGSCANHVRDVKRFFQAHHMAIVARNDDDVTADEIMRQVMKTTSNFTFVQAAEPTPQAAPVGSVYKPIRPIEEIKKVKNQNFWEKIQAEEESRKKEEAKRQKEVQKVEEERLKQEQQRSEATRKEVEKKREQDIIDKMKAQKLADDNMKEKEEEKLKWEEQLKEQEQAMENQRRNRRTSSVEHTQEAQILITKRSNNPRDMWKQREQEQKQTNKNERIQPPSRKLSSNFTSRFNNVEETTAEDDSAFVQPIPAAPVESEPVAPVESEPVAPVVPEPVAPVVPEPIPVVSEPTPVADEPVVESEPLHVDNNYFNGQQQNYEEQQAYDQQAESYDQQQNYDNNVYDTASGVNHQNGQDQYYEAANG